MNFRLAFAYKDGTYSSTNYATNTNNFTEIKATSTLGKQVAYIRMDWTTDGTVSIKDLQIEKGGTVTKFENHKEDYKEILLPQNCSFNGLDTIQDTIEETEQGVVYTQRIGKIVFNGTEDWGLNGTNNNTLEFVITTAYKPNSKLLCDNFTNIIGGDIEGVRVSSSGKFIIHINKSKLETPNIQGFKQYLKANPITVYYQLAEPKTYLLKEAETDTKTYEDKTYVQSLNIISPFFDFSIPTNYNSITKQQGKEINRIWDMIDNVILPCILDNNYATNVVQLNRGMFIPDNK